jgi:hypothetical protein
MAGRSRKDSLQKARSHDAKKIDVSQWHDRVGEETTLTVVLREVAPPEPALLQRQPFNRSCSTACDGLIW